MGFSELLDTACVALSYAGYTLWAVFACALLIGHGVKVTEPFVDLLTRKGDK